MSFTNTVIGGGLVFGGLTMLVQALPTPEPPPFLEVFSVEQEGENIRSTRRINSTGRADWRVVIIAPEDPIPVCYTRPGPEPHEGWSIYRKGPTAERVMLLDIWVNDPGCYERLEACVTYQEITTWTPTGPYEPVKYQREFTVKCEAENATLQPTKP